MNLELKGILENIVSDLKSQGYDPVDRPIVFKWSYPETDISYTLIIEKVGEDEDDDEGEMVH